MGSRVGRTYAADAVISVVVFGFLDHVATDDLLVAVRIVLLPGDEVVLFEQLLLVMLEFANHGGLPRVRNPVVCLLPVDSSSIEIHLEQSLGRSAVGWKTIVAMMMLLLVVVLSCREFLSGGEKNGVGHFEVGGTVPTRP